MELRRYVAMLWRRKFLIALTVAVAVAFTVATADRTTVYRSSSTIYVGADSFGGIPSGDLNLSNDQLLGFSQVIRTFALMIDSVSIAEDALEITGLARSPQQVVDATQAVPIEGTSILVVEVTDPDPAVAQSLATGMAQAFVDNIAEIEPGQPLGEGDIPRAPAQIFERATLATTPESTSVASSVFVAALLGFAFASALVLLAEYLDVTIKTPEEAERRLELPVLGAVPVLPTSAGRTAARLRPLAAAGEPTAELRVVGDV